MKIIFTIILLCMSIILNGQLQSIFHPDKMLHFGAGYVIGSASTSIADVAGAKNPQAWGILTTLTAAVGKEVYDYSTGKGTPEAMDGWMTMVGGILGTVVVTIPIDTYKPPFSSKKPISF